MDSIAGQRIEIFKIHASGHVSVYAYRGTRGAMIAIVEWHKGDDRYRVTPTDKARNVKTWEEPFSYFMDLATAVSYTKRWE